MKTLARMNDEELLAMRFKDLDLRIEGTWLAKCVQQLHSEIDAKGISFKPQCFLADEWLCPDGEPIIGIAFYLAHPRLIALESEMMLEAEGSERKWCMRLLRHEAGHTMNYAYKLYRKKKWREIFGPFTAEYPERYKYHPYSKRYVHHLDDGYAQYHPDEDFAETFAVWLDPKSCWAKKYRDWQAIDKLLYVDELMKSIASTAPIIPSGTKHWDITKMKTTLRNHYRKRRSFYAENYPDFHDRQLLKIFNESPSETDIPAYSIIKEFRKSILDQVAECTHEKKYTINDLLKSITARTKELNLYATSDNTRMMLNLTAYVTALTMNYLHTGRFLRE